MTRRRKTLTAEDRQLWSHVTADVVPLEPARKVVVEEPVAPEPPATARPAAHPTAKAKPKSPPPAIPAAPPLASLEKGLKRKLSRGAVEIDGRIDLHGLTQEAAHRRLSTFLRQSQANGFRVVVVITGKGAPKRLRGIGDDPFRPDAYAERGVLRRLVPEWLSLPDMRGLVIGFEEAAIAHGGAGALYVRIRRP